MAKHTHALMQTPIINTFTTMQ